MAEVGVVLLAAGAASRMGAPKQLLPYEGKPLVRHACVTALSAVCGPVIVVLGARADLIRPALHDLSVEIVLNERWPEGVGTSIVAGVETATRMGLQALILTAADQVLVTGGMLAHLVTVHEQTGRPIIASRYAGTVGIPALFAHEFLPALRMLEPTRGCKETILEHAESSAFVDCPQAEADIDTPADYERLARA